MIEQPGAMYFNRGAAEAVATASTTQSLDQRLAPPAGAHKKDGNIDRLYEKLKELWENHPAISSAEIIDHLRKFEAEDGSMPYQAIPTHTAVLVQVMNRLKEEQGEASPIYAVLYKGVGLAVVSNGILNNFIGKMISLPERPEEW